MEFIEFQKQQIAFSDNKHKGTPVVFVHGYCEDQTMWDEFTEPFDPHYRIIKIDLPGFGLSEIKGAVSIEEMADAVIAVLKHLKVKKYILIGHSMGGYVSLEIAKKEPQKLLGFSLFHSHPFEDEPAVKKKRLKAVKFIDEVGHEIYVKQLIPRLFKTDFHKSNHYLVGKLVYQASRGPKEGLKNGQVAMANRVDNTEILKAIDCPVQLIIGKLDETLAYEEMVKQVELPKKGSIHILEKVGHMGMFSSKRELQKIVETFLEFCEA